MKCPDMTHMNGKGLNPIENGVYILQVVSYYKDLLR